MTDSRTRLVLLVIGLWSVVAVAGCPPSKPAPVNPDAADAAPAADAAKPPSCPRVTCAAACAAFTRVCPGATPSCEQLCGRVAPNRPCYPACLSAAPTCSKGDACDPMTDAPGGAAKPHGR
jgi:hypothetical protein